MLICIGSANDTSMDKLNHRIQKLVEDSWRENVVICTEPLEGRSGLIRTSDKRS